MMEIPVERSEQAAKHNHELGAVPSQSGFGGPNAASPGHASLFNSTAIAYPGTRPAATRKRPRGCGQHANTIIPNAANPQGWNRYGYVLSNPIRYADPSGHAIACDEEWGDAQCKQEQKLARLDTASEWKGEIYREFGVRMSDAKNTWNMGQLQTMYSSLAQVNLALNGGARGALLGSVFMLDGNDPGRYSGFTQQLNVTFYTSSTVPAQNAFHEIGHVLDNVFHSAFSTRLGRDPHYSLTGAYLYGGNGIGPIDKKILTSSSLYDQNWSPLFQGHGVDAIQHPDTGPIEQWADLFANYVGGNLSDPSAAATVQDYLSWAGALP